MAEYVNPEDLPEDVVETATSGSPVSLSDLPPELAHRKLMAEQQGPPPVPTIAGAPPMPQWVNAAEEFLLGKSPYDPVKFIKDRLVAPAPTEPSVFGKTIDESIKGLLDLIMPGSVTEGILQAGTGYGIGKVASSGVAQITKGLKAVRPLAREIADESLGKLLTTPEAIQAKAFYQAADLSGKEIPIVTTTKIGKLTHTSTENMTFSQAQEAIANLKATSKRLQTDQLYDQAKKAKEAADHITDQVEITFPGFKATQVGYKRINDINRIQELIGKADPLSQFELSLRKGRAVGPDGMLLKDTASREARFLNKAEREEVLKILEDLGPKPEESLFKQMAKGRAVAGGAGALLGYEHGGYAGAAQGMAVGVLAPNIINYAVSKLLRHPVTRSFFKRSMEQKRGLANINFWRTAGALAERLGMDIFNPPPPPEIAAAMQQVGPPIPTQGQ
jgi:hypothetical protein